MTSSFSSFLKCTRSAVTCVRLSECFLLFVVSVRIVAALSACYSCLLCRSLLAELARHVCSLSYQGSIDGRMMDALCVTLIILLYTDLMFNTISAS
jgi:hypothetical protein